MCPWHGACFDVKTGDIEDGPSVDGLASYAVSVKGGRVYIEADEEGTCLYDFLSCINIQRNLYLS